jgi:hypothetical protein
MDPYGNDCGDHPKDLRLDFFCSLLTARQPPASVRRLLKL